MFTKRGFVVGLVLSLAITLFLFSGIQYHQAFAGDLAPGMVDTTQYKKKAPWLAGRAGLGDTNAWMTMFGLHFKYGVEEKYAKEFKGSIPPLLICQSCQVLKRQWSAFDSQAC